MFHIDSYKEFCKSFKKDERSSENAKILLFVQNWIIKAGEMLEDEIFDSSLNMLFRSDEENLDYDKDCLSHIIDYSSSSVKHIFENMQSKIIRENIKLPVHKVKEVDSKGLNWLSRRPGNNIKEKILNSNMLMMAVKRRMSLDTGENRLFISYVKLLYEYLLKKMENFPAEKLTEEEKLFSYTLSDIINSEEFSEIRTWENNPPNNALLSGQHYKKIWHSWNELRGVDELISNTSKDIKKILSRLFFIEFVKYSSKYLLFPELPVSVCYEEQIINIFKLLCDNTIPALSPNGKRINITYDNSGKVIISGENISAIEIKFDDNGFLFCTDNRDTVKEKINPYGFERIYKAIITKIGIREEVFAVNKQQTEPEKYESIILDLCSARPMYMADNKKDIISLKSRLIYQEIENNGKKIKIPCDRSSAILIDKTLSKINTILTAAQECSLENLRILVSLLRRYVYAEDFSFVFPDFLDDFQISPLRKASKLFFNNVETLPKSIAIAFQYQSNKNFRKKFSDNNFLLITDIIDNNLTFTLVKGAKDEQSNIIWERFPTVFYKIQYDSSIKEFIDIFGFEGIKAEKYPFALIYDAHKHSILTAEIAKQTKNIRIDISSYLEDFLTKHKNIIQNNDLHIITMLPQTTLKSQAKLNKIFNTIKDFTLMSVQDAIRGFSFYKELQKRTKTLLWKDHLPELAIKLLYGNFDLITKETVSPEFGNEKIIDVPNLFTLPSGKPEYHLELVQTDVNKKIKYNAVVKNAAFPLHQDVKCRLRMSYQYGAEDPYKLSFLPENPQEAGFYEAKVSWEPIKEYDYMSLPIPAFVSSFSWEELLNEAKELNTLINYLSHLEGNTSYISIDLSQYNIDEWVYKEKKHYKIKYNTTNNNQIEIEFISPYIETGKDKECISDFKQLEVISFDLIKQDANKKNKYYTYSLRKGSNPTTRVYSSSVFVTFNIVFSGGKTVRDSNCPIELKHQFELSKKYWSVLYNKCEDMYAKKRIFSLMSLISKDLGDKYYYIANQYIDNAKIFDIAADGYLGCALGDLSDIRQQKLLNRIIQLEDMPVLYCFAKAIWKNEQFVFNLDIDCLLKYFDIAIEEAKRIIRIIKRGKLNNIYDLSVSLYDLSVSLEYILGVFRIRAKGDPEINMKLSLNNEKISTLYSYIEQLITQIRQKNQVKRDNVIFKSNLKLKIANKGIYADIPNLLYALLVYITGNTSDTDIKIEGIS